VAIQLAEVTAMLITHPDETVRRLGELLAAHLAGVDRREWLRLMRTERDRALREAASLRYADLKTGDQSRLLAVALLRYWCGGWKADRALPADPYPEHSFRSCLWRALRASPRALSAKQVGRILDTAQS
jgi:hypothetical protein